MKRVVVFCDTTWSVHRVHSDIGAALTSEYSFIYHNARAFYMHQFMEDLEKADICLVSLNLYGDILNLFGDKEHNLSKVVFVCHGTPEYSALPETPSDQFTYAATSTVLLPYLTSKISGPVHVVPNGVDPRKFVYRQRNGSVKALGWCGRLDASKRVDWAKSIAKDVGLPLSIVTTLTSDEVREWYGTIDILLMTAGPDITAETGPLPPFEAIVSGVVVIGTAVGNFASLPGPKFTTVAEAVAILEELKTNPVKMQEIHKQQYECVMANWTYDTLAPKWASMFESVGSHYSFIEIGTSDFDTLLQTAKEGQRGLSIDPLQFYLDNLPNKPQCKKLCTAISDHCGEIDMYYVHPDTIRSLNLPDWVRGCNRVGSPHITVVALLQSMGLDPEQIIIKDRVTVKDFTTLFSENNVQSVHRLKIDTEGHDCVILKNYIEYCSEHPRAFAHSILFETNILTGKAEQEDVIALAVQHGYYVESRGHDTVLVRDR